MNNIHATLRQFVAPFAPPPISTEKLQQARALRQQQEFLQSQGVL